MAQAIAQNSAESRGWHRVEVRSAGVGAYPGALASDGALQVTADEGLSLEGHRSSSLESEVIQWADLILTMSAHHVEAVARLGGEDKASMLATFAAESKEGQDGGVPDPFGGDTETYRESFRMIADLIEATLERVGREWDSPIKGADS